MTRYLPELLMFSWLAVTVIAVLTYRKRNERGFLFLAYAAALHFLAYFFVYRGITGLIDSSESLSGVLALSWVALFVRVLSPFFAAYGLFLLSKKQTNQSPQTRSTSGPV